MEWRVYYTLSTKNIIVTVVRVSMTHIYTYIRLLLSSSITTHWWIVRKYIQFHLWHARLTRFSIRVIIVDTIVDKVIAYFRRLLSFYFSRIDIFINVESMFFTLSSSRLVRSTLLLLFLFNDSVLVASRPFNCVYAYHLMHRSNSAFRLFTREHKHYE